MATRQLIWEIVRMGQGCLHQVADNYDRPDLKKAGLKALVLRIPYRISYNIKKQPVQRSRWVQRIDHNLEFQLVQRII
ncbi:hypothetical protein CCACVL1_24251 [Corchorus capsularis]|uniref:Uncharacterized protein n=1 Tax=Corchorus capsularis TaxID=210143 RepID=A0A1R3GQC7_COCAP|nr:hypothetical protein CCACVL1_24251 [Corchorus capsularis]